MIPLRIHRLLIVLFSVSAFLALVDDVLLRFGLSSHAKQLLAGGIAGSTVFLLTYYGGRVLLFCGKGLVEDPERRAKIRAALYDIGVIEERRAGKRRQLRGLRGKPRYKVASSSADRRHGRAPPPGKELMFVSVVDSDRFIAITVNSGSSHRAFISTRMVDSFTHGALRGVLAHEYGHADNRHPVKQACILGIVAAVKFAVGIPLGAVIALLLAYLFMLREWEFAADAAAAKRAGAADVMAAFDEFQAIEKHKDMGRLSEFFSAHPSFQRRVAAVRHIMANTDRQPTCQPKESLR